MQVWPSLLLIHEGTIHSWQSWRLWLRWWQLYSCGGYLLQADLNNPATAAASIIPEQTLPYWRTTNTFLLSCIKATLEVMVLCFHRKDVQASPSAAHLGYSWQRINGLLQFDYQHENNYLTEVNHCKLNGLRLADTQVSLLPSCQQQTHKKQVPATGNYLK